MTAIGDTLARSGGRLARLAAVLPMLLLLVMVAAPALGHEQHSEGDAATGGDAPTQQQDGGADGRTDESPTGTADGEGAAEIPSPTPAYMAIPAAAGGAIITIGGWVLLWRRTTPADKRKGRATLDDADAHHSVRLGSSHGRADGRFGPECGARR